MPYKAIYHAGYSHDGRQALFHCNLGRAISLAGEHGTGSAAAESP